MFPQFGSNTKMLDIFINVINELLHLNTCRYIFRSHKYIFCLTLEMSSELRTETLHIIWWQYLSSAVQFIFMCFLNVCSGDEVQAFHEDLNGRHYINEVYKFSVDKLYGILFTESQFMTDFMDQRRFTGQNPHKHLISLNW